MTVNRKVPQAPSSPPIFGTFRRWPLIPSAALLRLHTTLTQCVELAGSEAAHRLLRLITEELQQRTADEHADARSRAGRPGGSVDGRVSPGKGSRSRRPRTNPPGVAAGSASGQASGLAAGAAWPASRPVPGAGSEPGSGPASGPTSGPMRAPRNRRANGS